MRNWGVAAAMAAFMFACGGASAPAWAQAPEAPPATAWGREAAIASVDISDDGEHVVAVTSLDGGRRVVTLWKTDDLTAPPYQIGSDERSEIVSARFIKNDRLFVTTQQLVEHPRRSYRTRTQVLDLEGNPVRMNLRFDGLTDEQQAFVGVGSLISALPQDEKSILVADPIRSDVYKLNLYNGRAERVQRGSDRFGAGTADLSGEIRARSEFDFDGGAVFIATQLKDPETGEWSEHFRWYARDRSPVQVSAFTNDPNIVLVSKVEGDREVIYEYDIKNRAFGEVAFAHPFFDAGGVIRSNRAEDFGEIVGFTYQGARPQTVWTDPQLEAAHRQIRQALRINDSPVSWTEIASGERRSFDASAGADANIVATSADRTKFIVSKSGPTTPPEYYIIQNGRITLLGRAYPELRDAKFGETSLIQYAARDGLMIPAFLTKPDSAVFGEGPYPTVIVPHGGPWARDSLTWDPTGWTQYFATRGYAVLQPQFRGSNGWGQRLWRAGDGEWGNKMQDDVDDGARWMISQGVAAPDRIAVHGYSYGGYVGMMAAVRPNGLYQCSVAGAGPATIALFKKGTFNNRYLREFQHPTAEGEDPLRRVNEVSIPLYLYTGDRDTNVLPSESEAMAAAMRGAGKTVKLEILPDMEHTYNTWTPDNIVRILTSVESFLENDCGPGGL